MPSTYDFSERYGTRAGGYLDLMAHQVRHVVLVSSLYESFTLAEDGHLHERVLGKFLEASPREPPDLTRGSAGREALKLLRSGGRRVDLIIASPNLGDMDPVDLARAMREEGLHVPMAVLGYDREDLRAVEKRMEGSGILHSFLYQGDARILMAIVQAVEDRLNVEQDTKIGVPVFLVVEDNVRFYSAFLPVIYAEVQNLSESVQLEAGNRLQRIMRTRARPKILLAKTYERALLDFQRYRASIMGVFSDMQFPRDGTADAEAGRRLVQAIRGMEPEIPVYLQSSHEENRSVARELGVGFLLKGSPDFLAQLRRYLSEHLFFGDFVFRDREGRAIARAADMRTLISKLRTVPAESVAYHSPRHDFSRWLRARGEFAVAALVRSRLFQEYPSVEALRDTLVRDIDRYRRERNRGTVNPFRPDLFDGEEGIVQIGDGSLGGKGRGLAVASRLLDEARLSDRFPGVRVTVPAAVVVGTGVFDEFLEAKGRRSFALQCEDETETLRRILAARLPAEARRALERVVSVFRGPLAVRSSSLLEDSPQQPLAGIYGTWLLPNDHPDPARRLEQRMDAVKRVYASTFSHRARAFLEATHYRMEEEAMAVVIQRLVGARHGDRFYPHISGVARSHNYYPQAPARPEDGIAAVALGLGRTVAEGEPCLRFSPAHPGHILDHATVEAMLKNAQRHFWAMELGRDAPSWEHDGPLAMLPLRAAEEDDTLSALGSTYSVENHAVYDGIGRPGVRLVTFAPVLKHGVFPLAALIRELLALGTAGTRLPVEIEFAATLGSRGEPAEMAFLQLRPVAPSAGGEDVDVSRFPRERVFCESPSILGHGRRDDLTDWIVVDQGRYERSQSAEVAAAVAHFNTLLTGEGRTYGLVGVGRWGSSQPWLGIPVRWEDISGARVIVEAGFRDFKVTPSQGTHFYQNLVSLGVAYFTVNAEAGEGFVDWEWLASAPVVAEEGAVRVLRLPAPASALLSGRQHRGILLKPEGM
ncbi:MAG: histidine kinase [Gemmatimonadetes bacterium]|nr:histidine kinase [Gemmatimonadota bacterium]